jgi:hypothetical protein
MKATPIAGLPFPDDTDAPDGPVQIGGLAAALDPLVKPQRGIKSASEGFELPEAYKDVPGTTLEITPPTASTLLVVGTWHFQSAGAGTILQGTMSLDGVDQAAVALLTVGGANAHYQTVSQVYALALAAAEKHTIKMRAKSSTKSVVYSLVAANTRFLYAMLG